jgi:hypothetical protein
MSTTYDAIPSVLDRVVGSDLIVLGSARGPVRIEPLQGAEPPRVYGWFEIALQDVLTGDAPEPPLLVRMIGNGRPDNAVWPMPIPADTPMLWMLVRDIGPDLPDQLFTPCYHGVYELSREGVVRVPEDALDDASRELAGQGPGLSLDGFRRLIGAVERRRAGAARRLAEAEPAEIRDVGRPEFDEYPRSADAAVEVTLARPGGARSAEINAGPDRSDAISE